MNLGTLNLQPLIGALRGQDPADPLQQKKLDKAAKKDPKAELREIAQSFESLFMGMLMKSMRTTVTKSGFMNGGRGEEMFTGLFDTQISEAGAKHGRGLGIGDLILKRYAKFLHADDDAKGKKVDAKR